MNLLAFDTSTEIMSIAVQRRATGPGQLPTVCLHTGPGGPQTSALLIPTILQLLAQAELSLDQLDAIAFGCGPGSFTGLRTACAVAQGLAFGAKLKVLPINTLLAVAEETRFQHADDSECYQVTALLDARMDEMYAGSYVFSSKQWSMHEGHRLIHPENLVCNDGWTLAGNVFAAYGARLALSQAPRVEALPTASALLRLTPALLARGAAVSADQALPIYVRDKVAKTTAERAAEKAAL